MSQNFQFIVCSRITEQNLSKSLGSAEYSYHFILKGYLPLLQKMGDVIEVDNPSEQVDDVYRQALEEGKRPLFLHFTAPQHVVSGIECPTILVFAWEYDTIPTEYWENNGKHDWRVGLSTVAGALVLSEHTVRAVKKAMGDDYPVVSVPTPTFEMMETLRVRSNRSEPLKRLAVEFSGLLIDSQDMRLTPYVPSAEEAEELALTESRYSYFLYTRGLELDAKEAELREREALVEKGEVEIEEQLRAELSANIQEHLEARNTVRFALGTLKRALLRQTLQYPEFEQFHSSISTVRKKLFQQEQTPIETNFDDVVHEDPVTDNGVFAEGVVYTAILNPLDLRKNWRDMLTAFCTALRDRNDAFLVIKVSVQFITRFSDELIEHLRRLDRFSCRVIIIKAHLSDKEYAHLMSGTSFYVNTSYGEGQCIPLTQALASGIPCISPAITAMEDYINTTCCLVPDSHIEPTHWQQDPRQSYRTVHHKISWPDLVEAFKYSYEIAHNDARRYVEMSDAAIEASREYNSLVVLEETLQNFLSHGVRVSA